MNDKTLARFAEHFASNAEPLIAEQEQGQEESAGAFAFLRGARDRAQMLELRFKDGRIVAFSYALLDRAALDPSDGIRLHFADQEVRITGRALNERGDSGMRLFDAILRHRATWIQESSRADVLQAQPGVPIVTAITVEE